MRAYVATTGAVFGLLVLAHVWRVALEGWSMAREPAIVISTLASVGFCAWAWRLLRPQREEPR